MSVAGGRLIRSVQEALDFVQNGGKDSGCLVIPADISKEERLRLIEEWMGQDDEDGDPGHLAEDTAGENHLSGPAASDPPGTVQPQAAASRKSA